MSFITTLLSNHRQFRQIDAEIDTIDESELTGLGLTRADLRKIAHMPDEQIALMEQMAARHGVTPEFMEEMRNQLAAVCAHCGLTKHCKRALAANESDLSFCPNHDSYAA